MDFTFNPEQDALRATVRSFLGREMPPTYVRQMIEYPAGVTHQVWEKMAALGWLGLLIPEAAGGAGLTLVDLVVVQEEFGQLPAPGPFLSSAVMATLAALRLGVDEILPELAEGTVVATLALEEFGSGAPLDRIRTTATESGPGWVLDGLKPVVLDGHTADVALVVARTGNGLGTFLVERPGAVAVPALDVTRKVCRLELQDRPARRVGPAGDQTPLLARVVDDIGVALCAETVGGCQRALTMATEYAKDRVQFDRPIATFQVIKHKIVDMLHALELCRVGTHYAAWTSSVDDPARELAAAMCKGFVGEMANQVTADNIQIHGGVGFTWDVDCHLLFRRVKQNDVLFGQNGYQRQRLAQLVLARTA
jgi:alkylation response protein AidB-like acyl-CoA dehydrogenase